MAARRGRRQAASQPAADESTPSDVASTPVAVQRSQRAFLCHLFSDRGYSKLCNLKPTDGTSSVEEALLWIMPKLREDGMVDLDGQTWQAADDLIIFKAFFAWSRTLAGTGNKFKPEVGSDSIQIPVGAYTPTSFCAALF